MPDAFRPLPPLFLLGTLWGVTPVFAKVLGGLGWPPMMIAACAASTAAVILTTILVLRGGVVPLTPAHLRHYLVSSLFGFALSNFCAFTSLQHVPAGFFAMVVPLAPMLTVLGAAALGTERLTGRRLAGSALGLAGVLVAMGPGAALPDRSVLPWAALAALTPVFYALSNLMAVRLAPRGTPALALAAGTMTAGAIQAWILVLLLDHGRVPPLGSLPISLLQGTLMSGAFLLWFWSLTRFGGVVTSQTGYIITLTGLGWGWLLFGERPGPLTLPAAGLIFAGLALVTLPGRAPRRA